MGIFTTQMQTKIEFVAYIETTEPDGLPAVILDVTKQLFDGPYSLDEARTERKTLNAYEELII